MLKARRNRLVLLAVAAVSIAAMLPSAASAAITYPQVGAADFPEGTVSKTYKVPLSIKPGQNLNLLKTIGRNSDMRPKENGWIVGFVPNLKLADGSTPPVDQIHLHHLVMLLNFNVLTAAGEEKTRWFTPNGFGYRYNATDSLVLNHMIHNLTSNPEKVI
ncbi:MAG: hypothetical protein F2813_08090, partial [Actinobacteria bacterium]|nr:hypothetical protein [Actinomycetota bacterium]